MNYMTVCFFGNYIRTYPRIEILKHGLEENGVKVIECHTRKRRFSKYWELYKQHRGVKNRYDVLLVCMGGQSLVWFAKLLTKKKIIFDAFVSLYVTNVEDRKTCKSGSTHAFYYSFLDKLSCSLATHVILDTNAQIDYFVNRYNIKSKKFSRIFIGANDKIFYPNSSSQKKDKFIVHWHGYIVPFYGIETMIKAAELLKSYNDIHFNIITRFNSKYELIRKQVDDYKLTNITFLPEMSSKELSLYLRSADICLGVFGNNRKAQLVIPNKIFEGLASAKPVITGRQQVLDEVFTNGKDIIMTMPENPEALAKEILNLYGNRALREHIGKRALALYQQKCTPYILGKQLKNIIL